MSFTENIQCEGVKVENNKSLEVENMEAESRSKELDRLKSRKKQRQRRRARFWDRLAGFIIVTVLVVGGGLLGLEYVILKGPSPELRDVFISTMDETRRFRFIPQIFMTADELAAVRTKKVMNTDIATNTDLITIATPAPSAEPAPGEEETVHADPYGLVDEDGDGIIFKEVKGSGYVGYMTIVLDPTRVFVGKPASYGGVGRTLAELVEDYGALGGINAGGFKDDGGGGLGGMPQGLTIVDGVCFNQDSDVSDGFVGLDRNGILHVGFYTYDDCVALGIIHGVSFGPILISNGVPTDPMYLERGVNPRTAIAQRADGAIIMLVIDGRQVHSVGASHQDVIDLLLSYGAVNACNLDGGSSTIMYYNGGYANSPSDASGNSRPLPDAFLYR